MLGALTGNAGGPGTLTRDANRVRRVHVHHSRAWMDAVGDDVRTGQAGGGDGCSMVLQLAGHHRRTLTACASDQTYSQVFTVWEVLIYHHLASSIICHLPPGSSEMGWQTAGGCMLCAVRTVQRPPARRPPRIHTPVHPLPFFSPPRHASLLHTALPFSLATSPASDEMWARVRVCARCDRGACCPCICVACLVSSLTVFGRL